MSNKKKITCYKESIFSKPNLKSESFSSTSSSNSSNFSAFDNEQNSNKEIKINYENNSSKKDSNLFSMLNIFNLIFLLKKSK